MSDSRNLTVKLETSSMLFAKCPVTQPECQFSAVPQVTPSGPQPLSSSTDGTKVTILRGTASGVINVPIDTAKPSDSIKASWGPSLDTPPPEAHLSQFERNASVPIPTPLEAKLAADRAVTEALAKEMFDFGTVIDNPLAGSKSLGG